MDPTMASQPPLKVYQGQFGDFTITEGDRRGVQIYRGALLVAALCFAVGSGLILARGPEPWVLQSLTILYGVFCGALGVSLFTIHIYMVVLHRALQGAWLVGCLVSGAIALRTSEPLLLYLYEQPLTLLGVGFVFVALTGIFFKEAFCFDRLETKLLTPLVPLLLLGHLVGILPVALEQGLLAVWALLFLVFALRKTVQEIPADIGDKSVFDHLKAQRAIPGS